MSKMSFDISAIKSKTQKEVERREGTGKTDRMKLSASINRVLILPSPKSKELPYKKVMVHQLWKGQRPILTATCGRAEDGNDCAVCTYGFELKDKYASHKSEEKQNLFRKFMPTTDYVVNALQLRKNKKTEKYESDGIAKILKLPNDAVKLLLTEIEETSNGKDIFDLDEGRPMYIKGNGQDGKKRRYEVIRFEKNGAGLLEDGAVDEEEVTESLTDLESLQSAVDPKKLKNLLRKLKATVGVHDEEEEDSEGETASEDDEKEIDEVEGTDDDDEFEDDEEVEDEDAEDDSEEDDDDVAEEDDDDDIEEEDDDADVEDDEEEEEPAPKPAKKKLASKKVSSKKKARRG